MPSKIIGIYPGTFDPITNGHADIISRASKITDNLILAISSSAQKKPIFSIKERLDMAKIYVDKINLSHKVQIMQFDGLLVEFANNVGAKFIIRGLRAVSDFDYEFQMACMNARLDNTIETIFLPASENHQLVSSRLVKEIASMNGDISSFVAPNVKEKLIKHYKDNK